jgi:DNA-directed RNA polymerase specialized sigma24 family protein
LSQTQTSNTSPFGPFPTTHWSLVNAAGNGTESGSRDALSELVVNYLPALRTHLIVGRRLSADVVEDLLQSFVAEKVLEQGVISRADPARGKFRTFLLTTLTRFVASSFRKQKSRKRAPEKLVPIDDDETLAVADPSPAPDHAFDVAWARQVLKRSVEGMRVACVAAARPDIWGVFEARILRPTLHQLPPVSYAELVGRFGFVSPSQASNVLVTATRMFERELRRVVAEYALGEEEIEAEIQDLRHALHRSGDIFDHSDAGGDATTSNLPTVEDVS